MFFPSVFASLLAASSVLAAPTTTPSADYTRATWDKENLEGYYGFKQRYRSLDCDSQKGSTFYTECCSPLGANESLASRPAYCTPTTCTTTSASTSSTATPTSVAALVASATASSDEDESGDQTGNEENNDENDEDLPWCDELEDDSDYEHVQPTYSSSSSTPASTSTPDPTTSSTPAPAPTTSSSSAPATTTQDSQAGADVQKGGFATFFYQGGNAGACGERHGDDELIGAIDHERYGDNFGVVSSECGRRVRITNPQNGKTVDITIKDVCPTCTNRNSIDLSYGAFTSIAAESDGYIPIEWYYL